MTWRPQSPVGHKLAVELVTVRQRDGVLCRRFDPRVSGLEQSGNRSGNTTHAARIPGRPALQAGIRGSSRVTRRKG